MVSMKRYSIAALVLLGVFAAGCSGQKEAIPEPDGDDGIVVLTTTIGLDESTRALTADGVKTFAPGDQVAVVYPATVVYQSLETDIPVKAVSKPLTAGDIFDNGKKALVTIPLMRPKAGGEVSVIYPAAMAKSMDSFAEGGVFLGGVEYSIFSELDYSVLDNQDGTLSSLAGIDLSVYTGTLTPEAKLPASITLSNQLAVAAFTLEDENGSDITASVTKLYFNDGVNGYTVSRTAGEGPIYLAMQPVSADRTISMSAHAGYDYAKTVTGKTLDAGKLYPVEVSMEQSDSELLVPLTIEAVAGGALVGFHYHSEIGASVQYSLNDGPWTDYDNYGGGILLENAGDKISFRGNNPYYGKYQSSSYMNSYFYADYQDCYLYGNVMSLVNATGFATENTIPSSFAFYRLFAYQDRLLSHPDRELVLPATTLEMSCYQSMFIGCTALTRAPYLPAETLKFACYESMFSGCTSLVDVPALNARTLANESCESMFSGCTALETAPALPAESMNYQCYANMFKGCSSLVNPPALPATSLSGQCYMQMFMDCTSLETAPVLPATTLANYCYQNMFWGCSNLTRIVCLATDFSAESSTLSWLNKVSETGTFVKPEGVTWGSGTSAIPSGWTVETYVAP